MLKPGENHPGGFTERRNSLESHPAGSITSSFSSAALGDVCLSHLDEVAGSLTADVVDLTVDDGDDLGHRQADGRQTGWEQKRLRRGQHGGRCSDFKHCFLLKDKNPSVIPVGFTMDN